jgi:rubredoxin
MRQSQTVTYNCTGGVIYPGYLSSLLTLAAQARVSEVRFGFRQQLLLDVPVNQVKQLMETAQKQKIAFHTGRETAPNITSSYVSAGIFITDSWLGEGVYKDVFSLFDYQPALKINICDRRQTFIPFFASHINWIAAEELHYWHLYIRYPMTNTLYCWPERIYTNDIATVSQQVERALLQHPELREEALYQQVNAQTEYISLGGRVEPDWPAFHLPYYEGFNRQGNHYWLGIYRRDELFETEFLQEICAICLETKNTQLFTTPWKSLIIKNIEPQHRYLWDYVLGKYRINVRHAANELNWLVEDNSADGLVLKRHIIRHFDKEDVRTYGLCFSIKMKSRTGIFGSVVIRKKESKTANKLKSLERFDLLYTRDFNPNSADLILFRENVEKDHIGTYLVSLCKFFYEQGSARCVLPESTAGHTHAGAGTAEKRIVHQCTLCFTVYNEVPGDPLQQVAPGTLFSELPAGYCCALCEAPLQAFEEVNEADLFVAAE